MKETTENETHLQLLKESLWDVRDQRNFFKTMNIILCSLLFVAIAGLIGFGLYNQKVLKDITTHTIERNE